MGWVVLQRATDDEIPSVVAIVRGTLEDAEAETEAIVARFYDRAQGFDIDEATYDDDAAFEWLERTGRAVWGKSPLIGRRLMLRDIGHPMLGTWQVARDDA